MKTLDEAMDVISVKSPEDVEHVTSEAARFEATIKEIAGNPRVVDLCVSAIRSLVESDQMDTPFILWLQAFVDGVKIGMEMERDESRTPPL